MKILICILTLSIINIGISFGADKYEIGDSLYVWANSGLNVRIGPSINHSIIRKIKCGEKIFIQEKSDFTYNIMGISKIDSSYSTKNTKPLIFYGNWAKIRTESGNVGFVIDQYLIDLEPKENITNSPNSLNLIPIYTDTINKRLIPNEGDLYEYTTKTFYDGNIISTATFGGYSGEETFIFENYTFEEVLIIFSSIFNDYKGFSIQRNWETEIFFTDNETCSFSLKKDGDKIIFNYGCSC